MILGLFITAIINMGMIVIITITNIMINTTVIIISITIIIVNVIIIRITIIIIIGTANVRSSGARDTELQQNPANKTSITPFLKSLESALKFMAVSGNFYNFMGNSKRFLRIQKKIAGILEMSWDWQIREIFGLFKMCSHHREISENGLEFKDSCNF